MVVAAVRALGHQPGVQPRKQRRVALLHPGQTDEVGVAFFTPDGAHLLLLGAQQQIIHLVGQGGSVGGQR